MRDLGDGRQPPLAVLVSETGNCALVSSALRRAFPVDQMAGFSELLAAIDDATPAAAGVDTPGIA
jgi:hypothetical protein